MLGTEVSHYKHICIFLSVKNSPIVKLKSSKPQHVLIKFDQAAHFSSFAQFYLVIKLAPPVNVKNTLHRSESHAACPSLSLFTLNNNVTWARNV
jgi:hypothetical protein